MHHCQLPLLLHELSFTTGPLRGDQKLTADFAGLASSLSKILVGIIFSKLAESIKRAAKFPMWWLTD